MKKIVVLSMVVLLMGLVVSAKAAPSLQFDTVYLDFLGVV